MNHAGPAEPDLPAPLDLSGEWQAHEAEGDLHRTFADPSFEPRSWSRLAVPGHWRSHDDFATSDGPVLYRRRFEHPAPAAGRRTFLELDGCFYYGDVWLDGTYLGATEGYFVPHVLEITEAARERRDHVVAMEVACPPQADRSAKRLVTGVFSHSDTLDPDWNPGGIWRPVRVRETGLVRVARCRVTCTEASETRGRLRVDLTLDAHGARDGTPALIVVRVTGPDGEVLVEHLDAPRLSDGENHRRIEVRVDDPPRWWPRRLGPQAMCELELRVELGGELSDSWRAGTAFRDVRFERLTFAVNGERLFTMGSNLGPTRMALAEATPEEMARDVELAQEANLDLLRVHAHVARPELYAAADRAGMMLWQDFPLQWGYAHGVRRQATRQAAIMVDLLAHHPSVVLWCAHNEPLSVDRPPPDPTAPLVRTRTVASMALPTWNKDVLDRAVARAIRRADPHRPVVRHSGVPPGPSSTGTDSHLYFGWYYGEPGGLAEWLRRWPRLGRFVSELGAQAVPDSAEFMEPERWPALDWEHLRRHHSLQHRPFERVAPPDEHETFGAWRDATQTYQAAVIQLQVEDLRRLKYRPTGGFAQFCLADGHPAVTAAVLDHRRRPKLGFAALRDACRPVLAVLRPDDGAVHVVSEARRALAGVVVTVRVDDDTWRFEGDVAADDVQYVGRVRLDGARHAEAVVEHPDVGAVVNTYTSGFFAALDRTTIRRPRTPPS